MPNLDRLRYLHELTRVALEQHQVSPRVDDVALRWLREHGLVVIGPLSTGALTARGAEVVQELGALLMEME